MGTHTDGWNTRALVARHKVAALAGLVAIALLLVIVVGGILTSRPVVVSDSTSCTTWGSANQTQQAAYARRYVGEHVAPARGSHRSREDRGRDQRRVRYGQRE